jgi:hypothetical protein
MAIGLVLAIIGSLICSSYEKATLTNYTGFGMLLAGLAAFIIGIFATAATSLQIRLCEQDPEAKLFNPKLLLASVWSIGIGLALTVTGFLLGAQWAEGTILNDTGYALLLSGAGVFIVGLTAMTITTIKVLRSEKPQATQIKQRIRPKKPTANFFRTLLVTLGLILTVGGSLLANSYEKETLLNYAGFGILLTGITILSIGITQTIVMIYRERWKLNEIYCAENEPRVVLGSIWAIGIGAMLAINGSLIGSSFAKTTILNYAGFGMLLAGIGVFIYGLFETARISAMGYINYKRTQTLQEPCTPRQKTSPSQKLKNFGRNLVKTSAILNLAGVMTALGLLFFSLWQLDIIVSGPVWHQNPDGTGWFWPGPGPYANNYFQCFLWKTTIGEAYDTLFMLIFISFIILFASAFFWPRARRQEKIEPPTETAVKKTE